MAYTASKILSFRGVSGVSANSRLRLIRLISCCSKEFTKWKYVVYNLRNSFISPIDRFWSPFKKASSSLTWPWSNAFFICIGAFPRRAKKSGLLRSRLSCYKISEISNTCLDRDSLTLLSEASLRMVDSNSIYTTILRLWVFKFSKFYNPM